MSRKVLFSPVGGTDPIKYFRDGSMLHICRHYQPDVVYLYLSHEMLEFHRKDNRYVDALERLGKLLGHSFEVQMIERDKLVNVQEYDIFYRDFREEIRRIEESLQPGDELLLNMASGTPAMKSALLVIATLAEYRFRAIQVSTPKGGMNRDHEERTDYDTEIQWNKNADNAQKSKNRCTEVQCVHMVKLLKIDTIKKHIRAYDYTAALSLARELRGDISEEAFRLLQIAYARVRLDSREIRRLSEGKNDNIYPIGEGEEQDIFEYALVLQLKLKRKEYADFVRGITPLVVDLLENILRVECKVDLKDCTTIRQRDAVRVWDRKKLAQLGLLDLMDTVYGGCFKEEPVYSNAVAKMIENRSKDKNLTAKIKEIVKVEKEVRNVAAHEIVSITDEWFREKKVKMPTEIFSILQYLIGRSGIHVSGADWKSYDKMNRNIIACLK